MISTFLIRASLLFITGTVPLLAPAQLVTDQRPPRPPGQNPDGMRIYLWAGLKSHLPGQHDYPQFLADWSKILTEHGAVVDGSLHPPSSRDLERTDVLVIYKGDAGYGIASEKPAIEQFVKRGGGLVNLHDALCGPEPDYLSTLLGGAKKHGEVNYTLDAPIHYSIVDPSNPIMKDMPDVTIQDEAFFNMTWAKNPGIHVLATTVIPPTRSAGDHRGEVVPQIWTYEHTLEGGQPARAFVWMQGHLYANFANSQIQRMLLRGIAWAGKKPVNELVDYVPPPHATNAATSGPVVPDWAQPGSPTHKQVPPPADFHRPSRNFNIPIGLFAGQSDVGAAQVPGSASFDAAKNQYTINSAGYNVWYSRDEFRFLWKRMSGDISLAADAAFPDPNGYDDRKALLIIRQNLDDDSKEAMVAEHGTGMIHLAQRAERGASITDMQFRFGGSLAKVLAKRIAIEKQGDSIAIFISLEGEPMHQFGPPIKLHFEAPFYVGIGFCSHLPGKSDTAILSNVVLKSSAGQVH